MGAPWGFVDRLASGLAFYPPHPPTYTVQEHADRVGAAPALYLNPTTPAVRKVVSCRVVVLPTARGTRIVAAHFQFRPTTAPTLLFSHGNAVDLAAMLPTLRELSRELQVNVCSYDYSGYGQSTGAPSVANTLADIEACYNWLLREGKRPEDVVLYGQSVGSGPSCHLAALHAGVRGVVLHSPLASGMRTVNPAWKWWPSGLDIYPNIRLVTRIKAPILIMHGTADEVVHITAGRALQAAAKTAVAPLWGEGYTHGNLELCPRFLPRLKEFLGERFGMRYGR